MKVCIISHSPKQGGAERVLVETVEALLGAGIRCLVFSPARGPLLQVVEDLGGETKLLKYWWWVGAHGVMRRLVKVPLHLWAAVRLAACLRRNHCDMVITNTITVPVGGLAATLLRLPHIWWIHEFGREDHGVEFDLGMRLSTKLMDLTSHLILASSEAVAAKYRPYLSPGKLHVLYYSVLLSSWGAGEGAAEQLQPIAADGGDFRICVVGSVGPGKNQEEAVRALGKLKSQGIDAMLFVVGGPTSGSYFRRVKELSTMLGVEQQVQFTGHLPDPLPVMRSCAALVMCSRSEAFGRVTVEAMKLAKPVVGSRAGGTTELIIDGFNGFLYTPGDHEELASKLRLLLTDTKLRQVMGEHARSWARERFSPARFSEDLTRHLLAAIPGSQGRRLAASFRTRAR